MVDGTLACVALLAIVPGYTDAAQPVASWSFEGAGDLVEDGSGNGLHGTASGCDRASGWHGRALKLDGNGGVVVPNAARVRGEKGFSVECWIRSDIPPAAAPMNLVSKADEFMLRVDPFAAGGTISLYVWCEGTGWEPRARGPQLEAGKWYHLIASWDLRTIRFCVNLTPIESAKAGSCPPTGAPLTIGGPAEGLSGFMGLIDEVRCFDVPFGPLTLARMAYGVESATPPAPRRQARFTFDADGEGWRAVPDLPVTAVDGALTAVLPSADAALVVDGLDLAASEHPVCTVCMAASSGVRGIGVFIGDRIVRAVSFRLIGDGLMRTYILRCAERAPWEGQIRVVALRVDGAGASDVRIDSVRLGQEPDAPPDVRVLSLSSESRCLPLDTPADVRCRLRNLGGPARDVSLHLVASPGIAVRGPATQVVPYVGFEEETQAEWQVVGDAAGDGTLRVEVETPGGPGAAMEASVIFDPEPERLAASIAAERRWLSAGYPRSMDFRHLWPRGVGFYQHNTALLVDMIDGKIEAARKFKRRYPDRLVLMQVNDELNGLWGSWHCVPRPFALKAGLDCDPTIFPMPEFRGYWLLGPRAELTRDLPADARRVELTVGDPALFTARQYGTVLMRDVLLYRHENGEPDWSHSEFASVVEADAQQGTIVVERWPQEAVGAWLPYEAGRAFVAPSVGSIYRLSGDGPWIKTWIPNLTRFCPRDPASGMDAVTWWARHFATLWHERIARSAPHPDGLEFDGLDEGAWGDCNNDGVVDGCEIGGVNHWKLGQCDFFRKLRAGDGFRGLGEALICADASSVWCPSDLSLLNGSENEEFPSFSGPDCFPEGMDLYRAWCGGSARPPASYLQGRFHCDTYVEGDWQVLSSQGKFHGDSLVRLSIASACMGLGIYTYRSGGKRDVGAILWDTEVLEYPWDEYYAGREGTYNWLGLPTGEPLRMTDHLGPDLIATELQFDRWELAVDSEQVSTKGPRPTRLAENEAVEVDVTRIDTTGQPRVHPITAMRRAVLLSPTTVARLRAGAEYCVECTVEADPQYGELAGPRFAEVKRRLGLTLAHSGGYGRIQSVLVGRKPRRLALTLEARESTPARIAFLVGGELGPVRVSGLRVREGCAEVFARRFANGLALANGSGLAPYRFDLAAIGGERVYRRFLGAQAPEINNGERVGDHVTVPPRDGLLLSAREP